MLPLDPQRQDYVKYDHFIPSNFISQNALEFNGELSNKQYKGHN